VRVSLKAVPGVDTVDVNLAQGLATVTLKPGNTATLKQLGDAIAKNGFTMKQSEATVVGKTVQDGGKTKLQIAGTGDVLDLVPGPNAAAVSAALVGRVVEVKGTVPEAAKGKTPDVIRYSSVTELK
jgi:hypothetical protein